MLANTTIGDGISIVMDNPSSEDVKSTLAKLDVHEEWVKHYRTPENEPFFKLAFDYILRVLDAPRGSIILDAGCGTCAKSILLANRGFRCYAIDFSEAILRKASANIKERGLQTQITIQREDITSLSFQNETFNYILCWGVLMHIPDLEKAISELSRVLKPDGVLVISEGNLYSFESIVGSIAFPILRCLLHRERVAARHTKFGVEYWATTPAGPLLIRRTNIRRLIPALAERGLVVRKRVSGEFTELYTILPSQLLRNLVHVFNRFWFSYIKLAYPALGNIIILDKKGKVFS